MSCVDLNCDLGESFGAYTMGMDAEVIPKVTYLKQRCMSFGFNQMQNIHCLPWLSDLYFTCIILCFKRQLVGLQIAQHFFIRMINT